ncbi:MAG: M6 family metalloprotease domain-containing protein [Ignavibacteriaceae bacterium]
MYKNLSTILLTLAVTVTLFSAPMKFVPQQITQPNGEVINCFASGDEFHNWLHDKDNFTIMRNPESGYYVYAKIVNGKLLPSDLIVGKSNPSTENLMPGMNISYEDYLQKRKDFYLDTPEEDRSFTASTLNNLVIFIRFAGDSEFSDQFTTYNTMFNNMNPNTNSMYNYFKEVSYEKLLIPTHLYPVPTGSTVVSYQDIYPRQYFMPYGGDAPTGYKTETERRDREHLLLKRTVDAIGSKVPVSLNIDYNNDGRVDNVCFIIKGGTTAWSTLLWPHMWSLYSQQAFINGKRVYTYNFQLQTALGSSGVGVLCHEMFHSLGAPDLYHYTENGIMPVGTWDIMESDNNPPQHMGAHMKWKYGKWIPSIPEITTSGTYSLRPLTSETNNAYRIKSPKSLSEHFIVEYRKRHTLFESTIPGSGLLVYRINTSYNGNADGPPDEVYIYRPGGTLTVNGAVGSANYSSDVKRVKINQTTDPAPFLSTGLQGGLEIYDIGAADSVITFKVRILDALSYVSPSVNEYLRIGETKDIKWLNFGTSEIVKIEFSSDSGTSWHQIADNISANSGMYAWTVPSVVSYKCKIRITDKNNAGKQCQTEGTFAIIPEMSYNTVAVDSVNTSEAISLDTKDDLVFLADGSKGVKIYRISEEGKLTQLSTLTLPLIARKVKVSGNYLFVANESAGLRIFDISNPSAPFQAGLFDTPGQVKDIVIRDTVAFVSDGLRGLNALSIKDLSAIYSLQSFPGLGVIKNIAIHGDYIYATAGERGLRIVDVSKPQNMVEAGVFNTLGEENDLVIRDTLLYLANGTGGLRILSISNPLNPVERGSLLHLGSSLNLSLDSKYAYIASGLGGLRIVDVSNSAEPFETGFFETTATTYSTKYFKNFVITAASPNGGVYIVKNALHPLDIEASPGKGNLTFSLGQNYPNPFNPMTKFDYTIASSQSVSLKVFDILGNEIAVLVNEVQSPGNYSVNFDASLLPTGVYFYRLYSGGNSLTKKMLLMK